METWYKIHLTQERLARHAGMNLTSRFVDCQLRANVPAGLALFEVKKKNYLFESSATSDEVDLSETYFLPPPAALHCLQLLREYSAESCDKPDPSTVKVSVGRDSDFDFWFS